MRHCVWVRGRRHSDCGGGHCVVGVFADVAAARDAVADVAVIDVVACAGACIAAAASVVALAVRVVVACT